MSLKDFLLRIPAGEVQPRSEPFTGQPSALHVGVLFVLGPVFRLFLRIFEHFLSAPVTALLDQCASGQWRDASSGHK